MNQRGWDYSYKAEQLARHDSGYGSNAAMGSSSPLENELFWQGSATDAGGYYEEHSHFADSFSVSQMDEYVTSPVDTEASFGGWGGSYDTMSAAGSAGSPADTATYWPSPPDQAASAFSVSPTPTFPSSPVAAASTSTSVAATASAPSTSSAPMATPQRYDEQRKKFICLSPGCPQKAFSRLADLERHYKMVHVAESQKESFRCDYRKCPRRKTAFHRKDHFRDHLREFHREDILKRSCGGSGSGSGGSSKGGRPDEVEAWLRECLIQPAWWRCNKCLRRIQVLESGWECDECKIVCERDRQLARRRLVAAQES